MNSKILTYIKQVIGIVLGATIVGISYSWFLIPYHMAPGGIGGIAQIVNYFFDVPVGLVATIINIPLFLIGMKMLGGNFGWRSLIGTFVGASMMDFASPEFLYKIGIFSRLEPFTFMFENREIYTIFGPDKIYLSAIVGSAVLGLGLGIIFKNMATTGGTDIPVAILNQKTGMSVGAAYWIVETVIILSVCIVFKNLELLIWSYANLFIKTKVTDMSCEGLPYARGVYIISEKSEEICKSIYIKLNRGVTIFEGSSGWKEKELDVLFSVCNRRQVKPMEDLIRNIDENAFVVITDVYDVMGYGFKSRQLSMSDRPKKIEQILKEMESQKSNPKLKP